MASERCAATLAGRKSALLKRWGATGGQSLAGRETNLGLPQRAGLASARLAALRCGLEDGPEHAAARERLRV